MNRDGLIRLVLSSQNAKTGDIVQTYSPSSTCPISCFWKASGACYASTGHTCLHWQDRKNQGDWLTPVALKRKLKENVVDGSLIRHNVGGDIAKVGTSEVDADLLSALTKAYKGFNAYTYTHCPPTTDNLKALKKANKKGFTVNLSCEKIDDVKKALKNGVPAVLAVASMVKNKRVIDGITFVKCPQQVDKRIKCAICKKCANCTRKSVIVFPAHGIAKNKAIEKDFLLNL